MHTSNSNSPSSAQYGKCIKLICHSNIIYRCLHDKTKLACWLSHDEGKSGLPCPSPWPTELTAKKPATISNVWKQPMCFNDLNKLYMVVRLINQTDGAFRRVSRLPMHANSSPDIINQITRNSRR